MNRPGPVRVMHLISGLSGGGSERWLWDIVRLSSPEQAVHKVVTIYPDSGGAPVYEDALSELGAFDKVKPAPGSRIVASVLRSARANRTTLPLRKHLAFPLRAAANAFASVRVAKAVIQFRPDVVHAHSSPDVMMGLLIRMVFRKPLVHTVACLFSQMKADDYHWLPAFYGRVHRWIDCFSTGDAKRELMSVGVPESKILYDLGGADMDAVDAAVAAREQHYGRIRAELGLREDARIMLSVGRLHTSKGHDLTVEALPQLVREFPAAHWVVLGEGPERPHLEFRLRELGVENHAHLVGYIRDPFPYLAASDIYLRTTVLEPENLSFYQAMAAGLPAVGFDTGWPDLITRVAHGSLVPNRDPAALADGVAQILRLPDSGRSLGQRAQRYAHQHLDLRHSVSLLTATYRRLSARHKTAANPVAATEELTAR